MLRILRKGHGFWCSTYNLACVVWSLYRLCEIRRIFPKDRLLYNESIDQRMKVVNKGNSVDKKNCNASVNFGYAVMQGRRSTMEDRIYIEETIEGIGGCCKLKEPLTQLGVLI